MRPIEKAKPGDKVIYKDSCDNDVEHVVQTDYDPYGEAKMPLVGNLGAYCSYCEGKRQASNLAVEHMAAKSKGGPETEWNNFLLCCNVCNSVKGTVVTDDQYHWPHINNTFLSFIYDETGRVHVNKEIPLISQKKAENLMKLVKLQRHKDYVDKNNKPSAMDYRWKERYECWNKAELCKKYYEQGKITADDIIEEALYRGNWSVWFTVFKGKDEILKRLITDFPGTCASCFDRNNHYAPIERNRGCEDPV